ncbi:gamma-glutamyltranspeptidase 1 [Moniliophthora roreri MCA 2997]|uniref:Glutathione hydrolase n=2 Tax=Moniliophthora roreri TaxID=221103 RepID=V2X522_MONRO|nr:gamma-glutamyltranspeptidase 1 [Moniliophthora roreri MCA 2997]KAI3607827.1 gamma-glutamyltranspeptidase 1 [Moniliophthora roreri]
MWSFLKLAIVVSAVPLAKALPSLSQLQRRDNTSASGTDNPAYFIRSHHGAVAADNRECSDIGVQILKDGGNAVDAAVAASLCIGVVNPFSDGIGGGGFMTVRIPSNSTSNSTSEVWSIDFRETAPAASNTTMFVNSSSQVGGLAVGVPGELRGLEAAHQRWGKLPWKQLVLPSVELAAGSRVGIELAKRIPQFPDLMLKNPDWTPIFAPGGVFLKENEILRRTNYSRTLLAIANEGADAFYKGPIADSIIKKIQSTGGIMTQKDLDDYSVNVYPSLQGTYLDKKIYVPKVPTSGPVLLHMLNIIEHYDFSERTAVNTHRLVEALRFGFAARTRLSDTLYRNDTELIDEVPTKEFATAIVANLTDDRTHPPEYYNPIFDMTDDHGTQHVSVIDQDGTAVSLTSTVNLNFGAQIMDPETGVILNDEMDDFSIPGGPPNGFGLRPSPFNYPQPQKRPLSSTVPTIIENSDGSLYLAIGGSGGTNILSAVFQNIIYVRDWDMSVGEAIESGRLHDQLYPDQTLVDNTYPEDLVQGLRERGHNVTIRDVNLASSAAAINGVMRNDGGVLFAASDSRKNGIAAGY